MKWIDSNRLAGWAERIDARENLAGLIGALVRASAGDATRYRFPAGENAQIQGWDGELIAQPEGLFGAFIPHGKSVWEWGVEASPARKAQSDWTKRLATSGADVIQSQTTFVFVTPANGPQRKSGSRKRKQRVHLGRISGCWMVWI